MPIKPRMRRTYPTQERPAVEEGIIQRARIEIKDIQNLYLPEELEKEAPIFCKLYNLGERYIPTSGHFLALVATVLSTMGLDEPRQANLGIGSIVGEGKTLILSQFRKLPFVNFFTRTTYSKYVLMKCGYFLTDPGTEMPQGVKKIKNPRAGKELDKTEAKDYISHYFDIITEGESIFTMGDVPKLLQLWNQLIEQGTFEGGDSFNGYYRIGVEPQNPVKHGLIIAATIADFERYIIKQIGWGTRMVLSTYACTEKENMWISEGIMRDIISSRPDISYQVAELLKDLPIKNYGGPTLHYEPKKVKLQDDVSDNLYVIRDILPLMRGEVTLKRAGADANRLIKGFALMNGREYATIMDLIILKSLLTMSLPFRRSNSLSSVGTRLHFQASLCLSLLQDIGETIKFITTRFKDWKGKPLYTENDVKQAIHEINICSRGKLTK